MKARLLVVPLAALLLAGCGGSDDGEKGDSGVDVRPAPAAQTPVEVAGAAACEYVPNQNAAIEGIQLPPAQPQSVPSMVIATNMGEITVTFSGSAPCTVNSFISLANQGYYDGVSCHRMIPDFVLQCGDPLDVGTGGPGYSFKDELSGSEQYVEGTVAMANSGPDTNGSQFFIVLADTVLNPSFTVFGQVDPAGMEVAHAIEDAGNAEGGDRPAEPVTMAWVR